MSSPRPIDSKNVWVAYAYSQSRQMLCVFMRAPVKHVSKRPTANHIIPFSPTRNLIGSQDFFKKKLLICCQKCLGVGLGERDAFRLCVACLLLSFALAFCFSV